VALVKYGGGIIQMSGSMAGNTFARNRYGNYVRSKTVPVNPNTTRQQVVRSIIADLVVEWSQTLTAAQRTAWNLYADSVEMLNKLGESIKLSGFNHFCRSNAAIVQAGLTYVAGGPTIFELPEADPTFAVAISAGSQQVSVTFDDGADWAKEVGGGLLISVGSPQNPHVNFFAGPYRYAGKVAGAASPPSSPATIAVPFVCTADQRVWVRARIVRADGRLSSPFRDDCIVGA